MGHHSPQSREGEQTHTQRLWATGAREALRGGRAGSSACGGWESGGGALGRHLGGNGTQERGEAAGRALLGSERGDGGPEGRSQGRGVDVSGGTRGSVAGTRCGPWTWNQVPQRVSPGTDLGAGGAGPPEGEPCFSPARLFCSPVRVLGPRTSYNHDSRHSYVPPLIYMHLGVHPTCRCEAEKLGSSD